MSLSFVKIALAALLIVPLSAMPQSLPDLGDVSDATLSEPQERSIGKRIMFDVRNDNAYVDDTELTDYLN